MLHFDWAEFKIKFQWDINFECFISIFRSPLRLIIGHTHMKSVLLFLADFETMLHLGWGKKVTQPGTVSKFSTFSFITRKSWCKWMIIFSDIQSYILLGKSHPGLHPVWVIAFFYILVHSRYIFIYCIQISDQEINY